MVRLPSRPLTALALAAIAAPCAGVPPATPAAAPAGPDSPCCTIPAETVVVIEIVDPLGSRHGHTGQQFAIRLAEPIVLAGRTVVPAGIAGIGEIVHAARARGSGQAGELILAARYLQYGERRIPLHRLRFARSGAEGRLRLITGPGFATIGSGSGGNIEVAAGARLPVFVAAATFVAVPAD